MPSCDNTATFLTDNYGVLVLMLENKNYIRLALTPTTDHKLKCSQFVGKQSFVSSTYVVILMELVKIIIDNDVLIQVWNDIGDFDRLLQSIPSGTMARKHKIENVLTKSTIFTLESGFLAWTVVIINIAFWIVAICADMHYYDADLSSCLIFGSIYYSFSLNVIKFCWITFSIGNRFAKLGDLLSELTKNTNHQSSCKLKGHDLQTLHFFLLDTGKKWKKVYSWYLLLSISSLFYHATHVSYRVLSLIQECISDGTECHPLVTAGSLHWLGGYYIQLIAIFASCHFASREV
ncbi:hypothetical protein QAD02_016785 [Eretmocerus hayati]|uniref:Uncharacterized protein n=1 Tax=Eretmocerus hayati TaxID=131215 RepID=A0ACC2PD45_9HYME|nr:hypothetical protein QAD02_016785 [Eretmocerus hayati]